MERTSIKHKVETEHVAQKRRRIVPEEVGKKDTHNKCEQKGRQKINDKINELKDLLPECQNSAANKAAILRSAADSIKRFQFICYQLFASNIKIEEENTKIREEISRLRGAIGLPSNDTLSNGSYETHNSSNGRVNNEPLIKPELVDPSSRFISTNNIPMRQDHHLSSLYTTPVVDAVRAYKILPGSMFSSEPTHYLSTEHNEEDEGDEEEEEEEEEGDDEKDMPSLAYNWK